MWIDYFLAFPLSSVDHCGKGLKRESAGDALVWKFPSEVADPANFWFAKNQGRFDALHTTQGPWKPQNNTPPPSHPFLYLS